MTGTERPPAADRLSPGGEPGAEVIVVGAGPVGLSLAIDLAWRGVSVVVIEERRAGEPPSVKCNHVSARTMEAFRRLGFAGAVRDAGLPADYPHDVAFRTSTTGVEFGRIPIPSRRDRFTCTDGPDTGWPTPEPPHRINQIYLEPVIFDHARALPLVRIVNRARCVGVDQGPGGVRARVRDLEGGGESVLEASYLVGCDGGRSRTRGWIGASLEGTAVVQRTQSTYLRAPGLLERMQGAPAWGTFSFNPRRCGVVYAVDGIERWLVHNYLRDDEADFTSVERDASIRAILGVDDGFSYEVLSKEDWFGRRLVADRFRDRRVFICGDASHVWVPYAGYGMNAGIADAMDLSWLLAASLAGWGGPRLLDAYEAERLPITEQVSHFAMNHALALRKERLAVPPEIEDAGPAGQKIRAEWGKRSYELNVQQYCAAGLNFGYFYDHSPIIEYDGATAPGYTMGTFCPSTVPGCRVPHVRVHGGQSLYDLLGPGYTVIRTDRDAPVERLLTAAAARRVPLDLVDIEGPEVDRSYDRALVLSRPDQHVAWRGDAVPDDLEGLFDKISGSAGCTGIARSTGTEDR